LYDRFEAGPLDVQLEHVRVPHFCGQPSMAAAMRNGAAEPKDRLPLLEPQLYIIRIVVRIPRLLKYIMFKKACSGNIVLRRYSLLVSWAKRNIVQDILC
jgi:hypothetical protein